VSPIRREAHVKRPVSCARPGVPCRKIWWSSNGRHSAHVPATSVMVKQLLVMKLLHVRHVLLQHKLLLLLHHHLLLLLLLFLCLMMMHA
jgi:hypothetical protein